MKYRSAFCTVDTVIRQLEISANSDNDLANDIDTLITTKYANRINRIKELIYDVSEKLFVWSLERTFVPYLDTITYRRNQFRDAWYFYDRTLRMPDDILSISSVTWVGTSLTSSQYWLFNENRHPNLYIEIDPDAISTYPTSASESVQVTGVFGFHNNPDTMWANSGDTVLDDPLTAGGTSITVTAGTNFETYQYIRIEDEYLFITSISGATLTVTRGVNGTTAASHVAGTQIDTLRINELAENATRRLVVMEYNNPGELGNIIPLPDGTVEINPESRITLPRSKTIVESM